MRSTYFCAHILICARGAKHNVVDMGVGGSTPWDAERAASLAHARPVYPIEDPTPPQKQTASYSWLREACPEVEKIWGMRCDVPLTEKTAVEDQVNHRDVFNHLLYQRTRARCEAVMLVYVKFSTTSPAKVLDVYSRVTRIPAADEEKLAKIGLPPRAPGIYGVIRTNISFSSKFSDAVTDWASADREYYMSPQVYGRHATHIVVNRASNILEYYESDAWKGFEPGSDTHLAKAMMQALSKTPGYSAFRIMPADHTCPLIRVQGTMRDRYCALWSMLLAYLRISCPTTDAKRVSEEIIKSYPNLHGLLHGWLCMLSKHAEVTGYQTLRNNVDEYDIAQAQPATKSLLNALLLAGEFEAATRVYNNRLYSLYPT